MRPSKLPLTGSCRCGGVKLEITALPIMTAACHCTGCQTMSGSAFSLTAMFPPAALTVVQGETVLGGVRGPQLDHNFCPTCMTWMFTRIVGVDAFVNVRPSVLADHAWFSPFIETMTRDKLAWAQTPARHRFAEFPSPAELSTLLTEFAAAD